MIDGGLSLLAQSSVSIASDLVGDALDPLTDLVALQQTLTVRYTGGVEAVTDLLENKRVVDLTDLGYVAGAAASIAIAATDFTDYILPLAERVEVTGLTLVVSGDPFLANLIVSAENAAVIGDLLADGLTVFILAPDITVNGTVAGRHVVLAARAEDPSALSVPTSIEVEDDLSGTSLAYGLSVYDATA